MDGLEKYLVLSPDGSMRWIRTDRKALCSTIRTAIGCQLFENVRLPYGFGCLVDESGKINGQVHNPYASDFYPGTMYGDFLFGPVVFVQYELVDGEPDIVELTDRDVHIIELLLGKQVPA